MKTFIKFLITVFLPGYYLSKRRKQKETDEQKVQRMVNEMRTDGERED